MTDITIKLDFDRFKSDSEKLKRILKEMDNIKINTTDKDDAKCQFEDEFRKRCIQAGLRIK